MKVKIKKLHLEAVVPSYAHDGDAGLDLYALSKTRDERTGYIEYSTGLAVKIPEGFVGLIFPRSSISNKFQYLTNSVGVIDSGYTGEIKFRFRNLFTIPAQSDSIYQPGDKIGQMIIIPYPKIEFEEVTELEQTERNTGGFGSSDR